MAIVISVVFTGRPMNAADGFTLCSKSLRRPPPAGRWVGRLAPPTTSHPAGPTGACSHAVAAMVPKAGSGIAGAVNLLIASGLGPATRISANTASS